MTVWNTETAIGLYSYAKQLPGSTTASLIELEFNIKLNGPFSEDTSATLVTGADLSGSPILVKIVTLPMKLMLLRFSNWKNQP